MIWTNMTLNDDYVPTTTYLSDQLAHSMTNLITQHRLAVFRNEDEMVVQSVYCMRSTPIAIHDPNIQYRKPPEGFA